MGSAVAVLWRDKPGGRMPALHGSPDIRCRGATVLSASVAFRRLMSEAVGITGLESPVPESLPYVQRICRFPSLSVGYRLVSEMRVRVVGWHHGPPVAHLREDATARQANRRYSPDNGCRGATLCRRQNAGRWNVRSRKFLRLFALNCACLRVFWKLFYFGDPQINEEKDENDRRREVLLAKGDATPCNAF